MELGDTFSYRNPRKKFAQSAGAVEYTDSSLQRNKTPLTSVLEMILNNLMVRLQ